MVVKIIILSGVILAAALIAVLMVGSNFLASNFFLMPSESAPAVTGISWGMKLVNETVTDAELDTMQELGITILEGEWGMNDATVAEVLSLLDRVHARQMKMIMNFTDEAAWGYQSDGADLRQSAPVWQGEKVKPYVRQLSAHPALFGYDIVNEAGENLPNGDKFRITGAQMRQAASDIRSVDSVKPIVIRMHYWDEADGDFGPANPLPSGAADIVMLNLYSNYTKDGRRPLLPDMVRESGQKLVDKIKAANPDGEVWMSLAAFGEDPLFLQPKAADLDRDISAALLVKGISNISFFGWGPERYPTQGTGWYLPRDGRNLLEVIEKYAGNN